MNIRQIQLLVMWTLAMLVSPVRAGIIFDTFGPNDSYNASTAASIGGPGAPVAPFIQGVGFVAGDSGMLSQLTLSLYLLQGSNEVDVWFMNDGGGKPGAILEAFNLTNILENSSPFIEAPPPVSLNALGSVPIYAGSRYWVVASAPQADTWALWGWKLDGIAASDVDKAQRRPGDADWTVVDDQGFAALRVTTVPEPSTVVLLVLAVLLLVLTNGRIGLRDQLTAC